MRRRDARFVLVVGMVLAFCVASASAQQAGKKEYQFRGKVEQVDMRAKTLTVDGEEVEGWMAAMTMKYRVDDEAVLEKVKAGDQITAKVYEGDFRRLYEVKVAPPEDDESESD